MINNGQAGGKHRAALEGRATLPRPSPTVPPRPPLPSPGSRRSWTGSGISTGNPDGGTAAEGPLRDELAQRRLLPAVDSEGPLWPLVPPLARSPNASLPRFSLGRFLPAPAGPAAGRQPEPLLTTNGSKHIIFSLNKTSGVFPSLSAPIPPLSPPRAPYENDLK